MSPIRFAGTLMAAALLAGCSDPGRPTDSTPTQAPALGLAAGSGGALVARGTSFFLYAVFDAKNRLAAVLNGRDGIPGCGEEFTLSRPGQYQDVVSPQDELLINEIFKADQAFVHLYAWDGSPIPDDDAFCAFVTGPRIARGTAHLVYTDSDLEAFLRDPTRADAFGLTGSGTVTMTAAAGGGTRRIDVNDRITAVPGHGFSETARIGLTPIR
jgi:hypothetical protein